MAKMTKTKIALGALTVIGGVHVITQGFGIVDVAQLLSFGQTWLQNTLYVAVGAGTAITGIMTFN